MKAKFMNKIEQYYGKYGNQVVRKTVETFISNNWEDSELDELFNETVKSFPTQYGKQPDVQFFNTIWEKKHMNNSPEDKAEIEWGNLVSHYSGSPILCTDNFTQQTINSMGGWDDFCESKSRDSHWTHKDFIKRYVAYAKMNYLVKPEVLKGFNEKYYKKAIDYDNIKVIGDESKSKLLIENIKEDLAKLIEYKQSVSDEPQTIADIIKEMMPIS